MPPTKKLKTDVKSENLKNSKKLSKFCETAVSIPTTESMEPTRLSLLNADTLAHIFQFLLPTDWLALSELGDPMITELVNYQRSINFSLCRKANFQLISSYFSRERVKRIKNLNFSYCVFARPSDFVEIICRCKNLVILSIIECGIHYRQILKILKNCSVLRELAWNIQGDIGKKNFYHPAMTKLFIHCDFFENFYSINDLHTILKNFPNIESAIIYCCPDYLIAPPFIGSWSKVLNLSGNDQLKWNDAMNLFFYGSEENPDPLLPIYRLLSHFGVVYSFTSFCCNHPPLLKVKTSELDLSLLSSCNSTTYSSVGIVLTLDDPSLYERLLICVSKIAGEKLKHLTFEINTSKQSSSRAEYIIPKLLDNDLIEKVSNMLETMFLNCRNITVLDIGIIHFTSSSPFNTISHLKHLRVLKMPTCAFCKTSSNLAEQMMQHSEFEKMVLNCWKVEDFHLHCCSNDVGVLQESDIFPIQKWNLLKSFTIYSVIFRSCSFLKKIADSCQQLQSFSLISTFSTGGCLFYDDVVYLLMNAKNLSFIRINEKRFNPLFGRFMRALSSAKNLEGICLMTNVNANISAPSFIKFIKDLKYLHLFHFCSPGIPESLFFYVKKSMETNGIKNVQITSRCADLSVLHYPKTGSYHEEPKYSCWRMHLRPFMFDFF